MQNEVQRPISSVSLLIAWALVVLDGIAVAIALVIVLADLIDGQPVNGLGFLLIPAIPLLALGQIWMIVTLNARKPRTNGLLGEPDSRSLFRSRSSVASTFGGLSGWGKRLVTGGVLLGWLFAMTAIPWITDAIRRQGQQAARGDWTITPS